MGSIVFKKVELQEEYVTEEGEPWYTEEEYDDYLRDHQGLQNSAARPSDKSFFDAMGDVLSEFDKKTYYGKSLNDMVRELP